MQTGVCILLLILFSGSVYCQDTGNSSENKSLASLTTGRLTNQHVVITGARFCYPLVQKWIDDYAKVNPETQIIIESRGSSDPEKFDVLVEVFEHNGNIMKDRKYAHVARYPIFPVANSKSAFAKTYANKGLNQELIGQLYFHDPFADKEREIEIKAPYTIYTRLQKAGVPIVFATYFGYDQKDIKGKSIAGADEHLLKAVLRDSTAVSYLPLPLTFDHATRLPLPGLTILPVDLNGNGRINDDEKFYTDLTKVIQRLESEEARNIHNIPIGHVHLSVDRTKATQGAIDFLTWVISNGQKDLHDFGYLVPESGRFEKERLEWLAQENRKP